MNHQQVLAPLVGLWGRHRVSVHTASAEFCGAGPDSGRGLVEGGCGKEEQGDLEKRGCIPAEGGKADRQGGRKQGQGKWLLLLPSPVILTSHWTVMLLSESGHLKPKAYENGLLNLDQNTTEPPVLRSPDPLRNMGRDERRWRLCRACGEEAHCGESRRPCYFFPHSL